MDWIRILSALAIAASALIGFYPALRLPSVPRFVALLALGGIAVLTPLLLPPSWLLWRFVAALFAGVMAMKMWDLHIGMDLGSRPGWRDFLAFVISPVVLVWRKRLPPERSSIKGDARALGISVLVGAGAIVALTLLRRVDWTGVPFLLEHVPVATALFVLVIATLDAGVALTRLFGGRAIDANDRPLAARTPAEFWRRYNRLVGQFLHEDFFKPMRGLRHPVRSTLAVFAVSGLLHEYLFWMAIGRAAGLQLTFFMLQGAAVVLTLRIKPAGWQAVAWRVGTFAYNALSSVFFFASVHLVFPIYRAGLPDWLRSW